METMTTVVLIAVIICQLSITVLAWNLIRITGEKRSWALIAVASALMAARPGVLLLETLFGKSLRFSGLWSELIALLVAALLLAGISCLTPALLSHKRSRKELHEREERAATMVDNAVTSLQKSEARYKSLIDAVTDYIFTVEVREGRAVKTTHGPGCVAVTGFTPEELKADPLLWYRMVVEEDRDTVVEQAARVITGEAVPLEHRIVHKNGTIRWVRNTAVPRYDEQGAVTAYDGLISDITGRKLAEQELKLKSAAIEASALAVMITGRDGRIVWVNPAFTYLTGYQADEAINLTPHFLMSGLQHKSFYRNLWKTIIAGEVWHGELINKRKNGSRYYEEQTITPVKDERGKIRHFVAIKQDVSERKKVEKALLENATIRRDMKIARQIQRSLLPTSPPAIAGVKLAGRCVPAAHVGGDYYDYFTLEEGILGVVIADVAGHSVGSALLMAMARSVLHATINPCTTPSEILASLNSLLHDDLDRAELIISMFYLKLDMATGYFTYANAGHIQPLLFRHIDSSIIELDAEGLVLGVQREVLFEENTSRAESGDIILLYTDGIPEAQNYGGEFFGRGRLWEIVVKRHEEPPDTIAGAIFDALMLFVGAKPLEDDTTLVVIKMT